MPLLLRVAAAYNVAFALLLLVHPAAAFRWLALPATPDIIVQALGMMVGVYGLAYGIAAADPQRYWPLVVVGIVGKTLGPIGFVYGLAMGSLPRESGVLILANDLVWWLPFWLILLRVRRSWWPRRQTGHTG